MGQDNSTQSELAECTNSLTHHTSTNSTDMDFDDNSYRTRVEKCTNTRREEHEDIETNDTQTYKHRIDELLRVVEQKQKEEQELDMCDIVEKQYAYANKNGISRFIADCGEYVMNIDSIYAYNVNKCALEECECIKREFRNRNIYDKNAKERFKLYRHCGSEKSVVIQQLVDQMHINKYHLTDIGLRYVNNNVNDNDGYQQVITNRKRFNKIRNDGAKSNKFVTQILD
eukprot:245003_1